MNLWDIDEALERAYNSAVDPETGEVNLSAYQEIDALEMQRDAKIENTALYVKNGKAMIKALADEIKALQERKRVLERRIEGASNYLSAYLDGQKYSSPRATISYRRSQSVEVDDVFKLPEQFLRYKDPDVDKTALKKVLAEGTPIPGARLVNKVNIQIK